MRPGSTELLILLLIVLLLFGASRLPKLARSLREARDEFEKGDEPGTESAGKGTETTATSSADGASETKRETQT